MDLPAALSSNHCFQIPQKKVKNQGDLSKWERSEAYEEYLGFIVHIGDTIKGKKITDESIVGSEEALHVIRVLDDLSGWIDEIPLDTSTEPQRYGNKAFRVWYQRLENEHDDLLKPVIPRDDARQEVSAYFLNGFGDATRIDYGTGHEMAFVMFLCCLFKIGVFKESDKAFAGLKLFQKYMDLIRKLQKTYKLEPAGSQGVWSLDDYQFVSFIWGSAQLYGSTRIRPKSIPDYDVASAAARDNHFFACIDYISRVKTGPFAEHSNQLWNISGVPRWEKVNSGLIKMYKAEVLSKFPVIQHVLFGSLFSIEPHKT